MNEKLYNIVRRYQNGKKPRIVQRGLNLKKAQAWCEDTATSSMTAKTACNGNEKAIQRWHDEQKHWFDGYEEEK